MYTFKIHDYNIEFRKHSNGTLAILSHSDISEKIKLGVISSGEVYKLVEFQWVSITTAEDTEHPEHPEHPEDTNTSDNRSKNYTGSVGLLNYIFDHYLGDVDLHPDSRTTLSDLIEKMLNGSTIDLDTGITYTVTDGSIKPIQTN